MTISVPADVISRLKAVLGEGGWSQDPDRIAPKLVEWRGRWTGTTPLLALPKTTPHQQPQLLNQPQSKNVSRSRAR